MSHIFISYSRKDIDFVGRIVQSLAKNKMEAWIDWKSIPKGEDWKREIERGIEEADAFLFLISPDSVATNWCLDEINHAVKNNKRILPILIRDTRLNTIHPEISKRNWIYCRDRQDDFDKAIVDIQATIHTDYEWLKFHTKLQLKALEWKQENDTSRLLRGSELQEVDRWLKKSGENYDPALAKLQYDYVQASRNFEIRQQRRLFTILVAITVFVSILIAFGLYQRNIAAEREKDVVAEIGIRQTAESQTLDENYQKRSHQLGSFSLEQLNIRPDLALLLAIEAYRFSDTYQARKALAASLNFTRCVSRYYYTGNASVINVRLSPDGHALFAGNALGTIHAWNLEGGIMKDISMSNYTPPIDINFDGSLLAVNGPGNGSVTLLDANTLEAVGEIETDFESIYSLKFGNQKNILAVAGKPAPFIELWDTDSGSRIPHSFVSQDGVYHQSFVYEVTFNDDDSKLAAAGGYAADGLIILWDLDPDQNKTAYISPPDDVYHPISFDMFGFDFSYGNSKKIFIVGYNSGDRVETIDTPSNVLSLIFKPSNSDLISGHEDGGIRWWNLSYSSDEQTASLEELYTGHGAASIESLSIVADSSLVASGDSAGMVVLWTPQNCEPEYYYDIVDAIEPLPPQDMSSFAVNKKTERMAVANYGSDEIHLLNLDNHQLLETLKGATDQVGALAFSASGKKLAAVESENWSTAIVEVWNLDSSLSQNKTIDISQLPGITAIAFNSSESTLALGAGDGRIFFYDLSKNRFVAEPISHTDDIFLLAYSPDDKFLASTNAEGNIVLWDAVTHLAIDEKEIPFKLSVFSIMQFTEDSKSLIVNSPRGDDPGVTPLDLWKFEWNVSSFFWSQLACKRVGRNLSLTEWEKYFPDEAYHITCPQWPAGQ